MQSTPDISVVMPVYNAAVTLGRAVASVVAQDERSWELVAVDDGSDDGSPALLQQAAAQDSRIRVISAPHGGIVSALNRGLAAARGGYVARMDADDTSRPSRLRLQRQVLDTSREVGLVSCLVDVERREDNRGYCRYVDWLNAQITPAQIAVNRFVESPLAHPTVMFRRELVAEHGGYRDGDFPEDYELWLRWLEAGVVMTKVSEPLVTWQDRPSRLTRTDARYREDAFYRCKSPYLARWLAAQGVGEVWVWGAGRRTRKRAGLLTAHGVAIAGYVDIDPDKVGRMVGDRQVVTPDELPRPGSAFVLVYVANTGAREEISAWLDGHGYRSGRDYLCCA